MVDDKIMIDNLSVDFMKDLDFMTTIEQAANQNKISEDQLELIKYGMGWQEWPDPIPLSNYHNSIPYPIDALPDSIRNAVKEVQNFVQCPISLVANSALTAISLATQGLANVQRTQNLCGPINLYFLAIAGSGERKTTCDNYFTKPIQDWENKQVSALKPAIDKYNADLIISNAKIEGLKNQIKKMTISGKSTSDLHSQLNQFISEKPIRPFIPKIIFNDVTPESLSHELASGWHSAGLLSSEGGIIFGGHGMNKESAMRNFSTLNTLWEAGVLTVDRRTVEGFKLQGARLTIGIGVQHETIRAFFNANKGLARGIGFIARFLIAAPTSTQGERLFKEPPQHWEHLTLFQNNIEKLLNTPMDINKNGEINPIIIHFSPEALDVWIKFYNYVELELRAGGDMEETRDVASKSADNVARLAANFHIFTKGLNGAISADLVQNAATIIGWHLYEAKHFLGYVALQEHVISAIKLDNWLIKRCNLNKTIYVSRRDIQQHGPYCVREKQILDKCLGILIDSGRVKIVEDGKKKNVYVNLKLLRG